MEGPRAVKTEEYDKVIGLINQVFRISRGYGPSMQHEVAYALNRNNIENMRIILDEGMPVSSVNYIDPYLSIHGCKIKTACIAAVCTHNQYRRRNLAGMLLEDAEGKMAGDGIDICIVSGDNSIYKKRNYTNVARNISFKILPGKADGLNKGIELQDDFNEDDLEMMASVYIREGVRFIRDVETFKLLYKEATHEWGGRKYKTVIIKNRGIIRAYIVLRIKASDSTGETVEWAGDRKLILDYLPVICKKYSLFFIKGNTVISDTEIMDIIIEKNINYELNSVNHTIKIINFNGLTTKLMQYFLQVSNPELLSEFKCSFDNGIYKIAVGNEIFETQDIEEINNIFFYEDGVDKYLNKEKPKLAKLCRQLFPLPLPYLYNMNYV